MQFSQNPDSVLAIPDYIDLDEAVKTHSELVGAISGILAEEMQKYPDDKELFTRSAVLHDIGKNYVPPEILNKPGKLTEAEYAVIKTHAESGFAHLVETAKLFLVAAVISLTHHERPDGHGYYGLSDKDIRSSAKIVAVADVLDALLSKRVYKSRWDKSEAVEYIMSSAGAQFDMRCVEALGSRLDEVLTLYED